jgi:L-rhamnose isomerase
MLNNSSGLQIEQAYRLAKERYAALGVDTEQALQRLEQVSLSLHCWQGDDVGGFESPGGGELGGGLAATGHYPGKARNPGELRRDLDQAYALVPGSHRLNLHAIYAETGGQRVERNNLRPEHFSAWLDWAKAAHHALDFNPTCFSHPLAAGGFTLASPDAGVRSFWVEHCIASRRIGEAFGQAQGSPCVTNLWIPDGFKDTPVDRLGPRLRLKQSLDQVFQERIDPRHNLDAVEGKLFGLGSESYVAGSAEFYLGYAIAARMLLTLDSGHFHPTETIADKISSVLLYLDEILLHLSRGVRWDSDHVVIVNDDLQAIMQEIMRGGFLARVHIGLDYFDASINRVAAWVIGMRSAQRALLLALLEPLALLKPMELAGDYTARLYLLEELKSLPSGAVWEAFCQRHNVPSGMQVMDELRQYEREVLSKRV